MSGTSTQSLNWPSFPKAILAVSRQEHYQQPLCLHVLSRQDDGLSADSVDSSSSAFLNPKYWQSHAPQVNESGPLPKTLKGHVFVIGTAASFDSHKIPGTEIYLPTQDGWQHIYSGDGMIYRLDFHTSVQSNTTPDNLQPEQPYTVTHNPGWAYVATRLIKTPDYYADWALESNPKYQTWPDYQQVAFRDAALTRLSMSLGGRNYLNTAWLPLKPKHSDSERLLVTWDAGRPYEVDPCSLGLVAPVGLNKDWKPIFDMTGVSRSFQKIPGLGNIFPILSQVFPMILSSAHPVYDEHEAAVYLVNGSKSLRSMMQISRLQPYFQKGFLEFLNKLEDRQQNAPRTAFLDYIWLALLNVGFWIAGLVIALLSFWDVGGRDHLFLYRWPGDKTEIDASDKWEVVTESGRSIPIYQSVHQMALTKDYIVISDSSFKFVVADVLPSLFNPQNFAKNLRKVVQRAARVKHKAVNRSEPPSPSPALNAQSRAEIKAELKRDFRKDFQFLFSFLNYAQTPYTDVYVISRADLKEEQAAPTPLEGSQDLRKVKAKHFRLQPETAHFLASYDNPEHKVVLHVGHIKGLDPAEFVNKIDEAVCHYSATTHSAQPCPQNINQRLQERSGVLANSMAPNQVGAWTLDMQTGQAEKAMLEDEDKFQLLAFFALNEKTANQVTDVYWNCGGAWPYHHTLNHLALYKDQIAPNLLDRQMNRIAQEGRPANLLRVRQTQTLAAHDTAPPRLQIEDYYAFPPGCYASSPQFVPRDDGPPTSTHGYIVCVVVATDHVQTDRPTAPKLSELWVFDAANLSRGPLYRLYHPALNIGPTLHTTWLSKLESPPPRTDYNIRADYQAILDQMVPMGFKERVLDLFEVDVFPRVIHDCTDASTKQTFKIRIFEPATLDPLSIDQGVEAFAAACGYHDPILVREEQNRLVQDIQYQASDRLPPQQLIEMIQTGIALYRNHPPASLGSSAAVHPVMRPGAQTLASLLKRMTPVDNGVFLLGQLMILKSSNSDKTAKTYIKVMSKELQRTLVKTPELFDSSQAMVNFLYNRAELPDAIAD